MHWPSRETHKPHMWWGGERWNTQCSGRTNMDLFGAALKWSWTRYLLGKRL